MSRLGQAITKHTKRTVQREHTNVRAIITRVRHPMKVELHASGHVLVEDDDFDLTHAMRVYRAEFTVKKGDTVLLLREGAFYSLYDIHTGDEHPTLEKSKTIKALTKRVEELGG